MKNRNIDVLLLQITSELESLELYEEKLFKAEENGVDGRFLFEGFELLDSYKKRCQSLQKQLVEHKRVGCIYLSDSYIANAIQNTDMSRNEAFDKMKEWY